MAQNEVNFTGSTLPGYQTVFDVFYGPGPPVGVSGITGALYHITYTGLTITNTSGQSFGISAPFTRSAL